MANGIVKSEGNRIAEWEAIAADNRAHAANMRVLGTATAAKIAADCEAFARIADDTVSHYRRYGDAS